MTTIRLDLIIYPLALVEQGISAYREIADIAVRCISGSVATLDFSSHGYYDEALAVDEFLNYLIALNVKTGREG